MTDAAIGYGSKFQILDESASPPAYVDVAEVTTITPAAFARDAVDVTHNASPDGWREFIPGLKDAGDVTFEVNFLPGNATTDPVLKSFSRKTPLACKIVFPDSPPTEWSFNAIVTAYAPTAPIDGKMTASITAKVTGKPSYVPA